jgi:hypothetical protein
MSIWKSPTFYLGIVLLFVIGAALAAPFVVDWNGYRDNLETYGRKLTGRTVTINGPISVRLFPWPRLMAEDVSLANPKGFDRPAMMNARGITMELALAGLFNGEIRVETIAIDHPVISLTRLVDGRGNWVFEPDEALRKTHLLEQVKLDQIKISDGVLQLRDVGRDVSKTLTAVNLVLAANAIEGPWRVRGSADLGTLPLDILVSSSEWKDAEPFRFGIRVVPQDAALPAFVFDGQQQSGQLKGKLRVEPVVTTEGKRSLEGQFKPLQMEANVEATFDNIALTGIHIVPADSKDSGTLIEGTASVGLKDGVKAKVALNSPRLDLDSLAGSQSLRVWRAGGVMGVLNGVMKDFPQKLNLMATLDVAALSAAGEKLENVRLIASAEQNFIRIQNLTAGMPGRSAMKFDGLIFPGDQAAELSGNLSFESNDARQFVSWLWPEGKAQLVRTWTGSRGRFKSQSGVTWSGKRFAFQNLKYELDGEPGDATLSVRLGALPAVDLLLNATSLDLDTYLTPDFSVAFAPFMQSDNGFEKRLVLQAGKLRLNGVEAQNVGLDYDSSLSGFQVRKLEVGSIEGARIQGQGLVLQGPDGPSGDVKLSMNAENPRGFLKLLGVIKKGIDPPWSDVLGVTDMQASFTVKPGTSEPSVTYDLNGTSGPIHISASGDVKDWIKGENATLGLSSELTSGDSADLLRLFGIRTVTSGKGAGKLVVTVSGSQSAGFKTVLDTELFGGKFGFEGSYKAGPHFPLLDGKLVLNAPDGIVIGKAIGLPLQNGLSGALHIEAEVKPSDSELSFSKITADLGGQKISGQASVLADGNLNADLAFGSLELSQILAATFMPWRGEQPSMTDSFSSSSVATGKGEIWLRPSLFHAGTGRDLSETVVGIAYDETGRSLSVASRGADGEAFKFDLTVKPKDGTYTVSGSSHASIDLGSKLSLRDGKSIAKGAIILDGAFTGEGRSPQAALSSLLGNGTYVLPDASLNLISPQNFFQKLSTIQDAVTLQQAFDSLLQGPGMKLSAERLAFSVQNGSANFQPLKVSGPEADVTLVPNADLADGELVLDITIQPKNRTDLPAMRITYVGAPNTLVRRSDTAAISAKLGYAIIAKDVAELERVQKEQAKLVAEGEAQRKADEEKFAAFQAQREELRLRQRELRVHAAQRVIDSAKLKAKWDRVFSLSQAINAREMPRLLQRLKSKQAP